MMTRNDLPRLCLSFLFSLRSTTSLRPTKFGTLLLFVFIFLQSCSAVPVSFISPLGRMGGFCLFWRLFFIVFLRIRIISYPDSLSFFYLVRSFRIMLDTWSFKLKRFKVKVDVAHLARPDWFRWPKKIQLPCCLHESLGKLHTGVFQGVSTDCEGGVGPMDGYLWIYNRNHFHEVLTAIDCSVHGTCGDPTLLHNEYEFG